jgi:hypothetical protein
MDAGWYYDPRRSGVLRYYDGKRWTDQTAPAPVPGAGSPGTVPSQYPHPDRRQRWSMARRMLLTIVVLVGALVLIAAAHTYR